MIKNSIILIIITIFIVGCASKSSNIISQPVSYEQRMQYQEYTCDKIKNELIFLKEKERKLNKIQDDHATSDKILISWGWILYGVPYVFLYGNKDKVTKELKITLGKEEALKKIAIDKNCKFIWH
jgi:hypothetical protein